MPWEQGHAYLQKNIFNSLPADKVPDLRHTVFGKTAFQLPHSFIHKVLVCSLHKIFLQLAVLNSNGTAYHQMGRG